MNERPSVRGASRRRNMAANRPSITMTHSSPSRILRRGESRHVEQSWDRVGEIRLVNEGDVHLAIKPACEGGGIGERLARSNREIRRNQDRPELRSWIPIRLHLLAASLSPA